MVDVYIYISTPFYNILDIQEFCRFLLPKQKDFLFVHLLVYIGIHTSKGLAEWFSIDLTHRGQRFDSSNSYKNK